MRLHADDTTVYVSDVSPTILEFVVNDVLGRFIVVVVTSESVAD